jgi:ssDNA-binding Zn-finger/Zn-ribbon topoisomerase 1
VDRCTWCEDDGEPYEQSPDGQARETVIDCPRCGKELVLVQLALDFA